ncbi:MAG TPA: lactoylglutathione lyase [Bacteroidales bacterium]|nr:lactoylglutathione lyase [Bacteroidales bacterium]
MTAKNPVNWFEIYVDNIDRAKKFYETVLGNKMTDLPMPDGMNAKMVSFPWQEGGVNATGALVQTESVKAGGNSILVYFQTEDCLAEQNRVEKAGGKVVQPKFAIGDYGFCSLCLDSEGNMFGLHSMK